MTTAKSKGIAVLAEVVAVLARHSNLRVTPVVEEDRGVVALTVRVQSDGEDGLQVLSLLHELQHVADIAQVRAIAATYDIDAAKLEALLPDMHDDAQPHAVRHLTVREIDFIVQLLHEVDLPLGADAPLLHTALSKLARLGRAMGGAL